MTNKVSTAFWFLLLRFNFQIKFNLDSLKKISDMKEIESEKEEKLREAACFGDAHAVRLLLKVIFLFQFLISFSFLALNSNLRSEIEQTQRYCNYYLIALITFLTVPYVVVNSGQNKSHYIFTRGGRIEGADESTEL